uniref:Uncharacterized protein n=1 Tax=Peronospora matthiolae TaxID=2874970 RepID=A0AAV1TET5_9STRA
MWRTSHRTSAACLLAFPSSLQMETPPKEKAVESSQSKQLHARLKRQMESEMDVEGNPEMERMGDEVPVHAAAIKALADDFDDDDLS